MATQAPRRRSNPPPPTTSVPPALVSAVAFVLATAASAVAVLPGIAAVLGFTTALELAVLLRVLQVVSRWPEPKLEGIGAAQREVIRINNVRRAAFIVAASQRAMAEVRALMGRGMSETEALARVQQSETRYFLQHVQASTNRVQAATKIDALAERYGEVLGWYAVNDKATTAECRYANGKNFSALYPPKIGWPGVVHVNCRCLPGPPHRRARMLA